ncbi:MAG: helix-turn-helix domain-containing protein [Steroidobacteraceae bacterium]
MSDPESLQALAARIRATDALGRSQLIQKLFDFLIECSATGRAPKEAEVAIEVFGKDMNFDVAQDAMVRVYVHKLRRKLEEYYAGAGRGDPHRLTIPKGAYRFVIDDPTADAVKIVAPIPEPPLPAPDGAPPPAGTARRWLWPTLAASVVINLLCLGALFWHHPQGSAADPVGHNPLWTRMLNSDRPLLIVLGDYYIFAETDRNMEVQRLVREFSINSPADLDQYLKLHPDLADRYQDMQLNYLPTSSAYALKDLMPLLAGASARTRVVMASDVTPAMLKSSDVIYIGYLSGMGMLSDLVFSGSRFDVGESFDVLIDRASGKRYISQAAMPVPGEQTYHDYGYFATFAGPTGNQIMIIAGTRDVAVMHTAESITHQDPLQQLNSRSGNARSFDALYDVFAMDGTNLNGTLLLTGSIDTARIWADAAPARLPATARVP